MEHLKTGTKKTMARVGERHGMALISRYVMQDINGNALFEITCDCGQLSIKNYQLIQKVKSCGCDRSKKISEKTKTHGLTDKSPIYSIWVGIRKRCTNPNSNRYRWYGAKGIKVCERWDDFKNFHDDMIESYWAGATIDRIDSKKDYEPSNCRWLDRSENTKLSRQEKINRENNLAKTEWDSEH